MIRNFLDFFFNENNCVTYVIHCAIDLDEIDSIILLWYETTHEKERIIVQGLQNFKITPISLNTAMRRFKQHEQH